MTAPWFDANTWAWVPGTVFGCLGGLWGTVVGLCAPTGKARGLVTGSWLVLMAASVVFLAAGLVGLVAGQPYGIWFFLMLPGLQGLVVLPILFPVVLKRYREAEERKMEARDLLS